MYGPKIEDIRQSAEYPRTTEYAVLRLLGELSLLMVRRRFSAVSNHEATSRAASFETRYALLRMRGSIWPEDRRHQTKC
jgi:hypothetical protein